MKYSVTFIQAGNPIYALFMTFRVVGSMQGQVVYGSISKQRKWGFCDYLFHSLSVSPLIFAVSSIAGNMVSFD